MPTVKIVEETEPETEPETDPFDEPSVPERFIDKNIEALERGYNYGKELTK